MITIDNAIDESAIGGNASAEGGDDGGADDTKETGKSRLIINNRIILSFSFFCFMVDLPKMYFVCGMVISKS